MNLKLREVALFYSKEPFAESREPLKASENKYKFIFSNNAKANELEKKLTQMMLKFIKQTIEFEKRFKTNEDEAFYLMINHNIKKEGFDAIEKFLGYDVNPEEVLKTIFDEKNKLLKKSSKLKNLGKKDQVFISLFFSKGPVKDHYYIASLEVVYYYDVL
ncbi:hypothetical protein PGDDIFCJ_00132 [Thermus phage YS40_Isch]|nr:hypothetical protein PGDDIFCJ_00132 [Thermus phage YS40_Isch]